MAFKPEQLAAYWEKNPEALTAAIKANPAAWGITPAAPAAPTFGPTLTEAVNTSAPQNAAQAAASANSPTTPNDTRLISHLQSGNFYTGDHEFAGMTVAEQAEAQGKTKAGVRRSRRLDRSEMDLAATVEALGPDATPQDIINATLAQQGPNVAGSTAQSGGRGAGGRSAAYRKARQDDQYQAVVNNLGDTPLMYRSNRDGTRDDGKGKYVYALNTGYGVDIPEGYEYDGSGQAGIDTPGEYVRLREKKVDKWYETPGGVIKTLVPAAIGAATGFGAASVLGLTGAYAGATSGAVNAATQGAIRGDLDIDDVLTGAAVGGITAAGGDALKDITSEAIDPALAAEQQALLASGDPTKIAQANAMDLRATTTDFGGLVGEKGLFSGIPEVDITGVRTIADATGDFFFGPSTTQEWVQMADGTKVYPDPDTGLVTLPDGTVAPMNTIQNNISSFPGVQDTLMQEAGTGGLLSPIAPILDTAITPIADELATAIVGSNPWHDERLTLEERLAAERSANASSESIYRELPNGMTGNYPAPSEEEQAASETLVVGPQEPTQEEAEEIVEDLLEGDEELILGTGTYEPSGTGETLPTGGGEEIVQGGEDLPSGGDDDTLPTGGDNFPNPDPETIFTSTEDPVGQTQALPPGGGGGGGSAVAAARARAKLKAADPELFRLARIMQVEGLPQSVYEAALGRINGILKGRQGNDYEGDVTREIDPLSGRYIQRVKGERGETRRRAMLRELKEKEMTT